jgi:hypothetical protein
MMNRTLFSGLLVVVVGCGGAAQTAPRSPETVQAPTPETAAKAPPHAEGQPWALPEGPRDAAVTSSPPREVRTETWAKAIKAKGISAPPASCAAFAKPALVKPVPTDLSAVLLETDAAKRNAQLFTFESANPATAAVIRAMRADLAPIECADAITDPALTSSPKVSGVAGQMALGLSLASKLSRTAANAPVMKDASDKQKVKAFIQGPLRQWMVEQATAIDTLSVPAGELTGLARGVVAIEAGMADLRLVDRIRSAPTPSTWDKELKAIYEAALDEALEPRKTRGRDAALVGLADFAAAGVVQDPRVERARALLSKLYGGSRIDALDGLLLPLEGAGRSEPAQAIKETVLLLVPTDADAAAFTKVKFPPATPGKKSARARFDMGRKYWRRVDFVEAAHAAAKDPSPESRLVLALSLALAKGPANAKEMMSAPSPAALGLTNTDALDALAAESSKLAGMAAFDAAYLRALSPPDGGPAVSYLADVAARFRKAAGLLEDADQKKRAEDRAANAEAASKAVSAATPNAH